MADLSLTPAEFSPLLEVLGPFEPRLHLAVAVSGGADSLALCLLAHDWAQAQGGRITALTVDHNLRPESASEAMQVQAWLEARGITHITLRAELENTAANIQETARLARYALMAEYCKAHHILHLLTAHHRGDQAETMLLRLTRGSGLEGLASMPPLQEIHGMRLLRPLLDIPKARLEATLAAHHQPWLEDPSNHSPHYARTRLRTALTAVFSEETLLEKRLADTAQHLGRARAALERQAAQLLARAAHILPEGYATLTLPAWQSAPEEIRLRTLSSLLQCIGADSHPPRLENLGALHAALFSPGFTRKTLSGCLLTRRDNRLLIQREPAALAPSLPIAPGGEVLWDGRFTLRLPPSFPPGPYTVSALGEAEATRLRNALKGQDRLPTRLPHTLLSCLPALRRLEELLIVPHIRYARKNVDAAALPVRFTPPKPLAGAAFFTRLHEDT